MNRPRFPPAPQPGGDRRDDGDAHEHETVPSIDLLSSVEATEVGSATVDAIKATVHDLGGHYPRTAPVDMLHTLQHWQKQLASLLSRRSTLAQRRELMRQAGWLSLLAATADIDVARGRSAAANFAAARSLADETGDTALTAWVNETQAWQAVSSGDLKAAADRCAAGLEIAQPGSEVWIQLCT